ncbi:ankyrin repeat-containing domain protein [Xylariaceae sp. FL0594]|nr:ankyrin repeat-containing domain protein [Xylariaceae sp. FL0594]
MCFPWFRNFRPGRRSKERDKIQKANQDFKPQLTVVPSGLHEQDQVTQSSQESKPQLTVTHASQHEHDEVPQLTSVHAGQHEDDKSNPEPPEPYASLVDLWNEAMDNLTEDERREMVELKAQAASKSTNTPQDVASSLQEQLDKTFKTQKADSSKAGRVIESSIRILKEFLSAGDVAVSFDPMHAALPWAAVRAVLVLVTSHFELRNQILAGLTMVSSHVAQCDRYHQLYMTPEPALRPTEAALARFALRLHRSKTKSVTAVFSLGDVESRLQNLSHCGSNLMQAAEDCEASCSLSNRSSVRQLSELTAKLTNTVQDQMDLVLAQIEETERLKVLDWISPVKYGDHHNAVQALRTPETGEWLVDHYMFCEWEELQSSAVLWLQGSRFAFFYCTRHEEERRQPLSVLRSYVSQLSTTPERPDRIRKQLQHQYSDLRQSGASLGLSDCREQLRQSVDLYSRTTIVLDGLDECDQSSRRQIIETLELLLESSNPVKIFIASRPEGDIRNRFCNRPSIEIRATDNKEDIKKFVHAEMARHNMLLSKSQGMFQWAFLQVKELFKLETEPAIRDRLGKLPDSLKDAYDEIYQNIQNRHPHERDLAVNAFKLVASARETLGKEELLQGILISSQADAFQSSATITESQLLNLCHNLLVFDSKTMVWRFSHLSVTEYFEENHWGLLDAHRHTTIVCLEAVRNFYKPPIPESREGNPFVTYAAMHWLDHFRSLLGSRERSSPEYQAWLLRAYKPEHCSIPYCVSPVNVTLFAMCIFSFYHILQDWWDEEGIDVSLTCEAGLNLLGLAAVGGSPKICQSLIEKHGMHVDSPQKNKISGSALVVAIEHGHDEVVKYLVQKAGADVNMQVQTGEYGSALAAAAYKPANSGIIKLLFEAGADVNLQLEKGNYGSALAAAAAGGRKDNLELLLRLGADVDMQLKAGLSGSALVHATVWGNSECVESLLGAGANVNMQLQWGYYGSALAAAAASVLSASTVELLLKAGAVVDMELQGGHFGSALAATAYWGDRFHILLLLREGADVNKQLQTGKYESALVAAAAGQQLHNFKLLLEAGAEVNMDLKTGPHGSVLVAALFLVFDLQVDVNYQIRHGRFGSALAAASYFGLPQSVELLIKAGADVNLAIENGPFRTALQTAEEDSSKEALGDWWDLKGSPEVKGKVGSILRSHGAIG